LDDAWLNPELRRRVRKTFHTDREAAVQTAFKVVEERLRAITGSRGAYGDRLIREALQSARGSIAHGELTDTEFDGLLQFFLGAAKFVRNPRSHRFVDSDDIQMDIECIILANLLLDILDGAGPSEE
jgi:uncharacterized protein (TIGR02391 family)